MHMRGNGDGMGWDDDNTNAEIALLLLVLQIAYSLTKPNIMEERVSTDNIEIIFYIIQNVNPIYNECRLTLPTKSHF